MWLLQNEGRDSLTVSAVCERAAVTPMAIYRRVDGLPGLFWAIYDRGMADVIQTYDTELREAEGFAAARPERVSRVVLAVARTFERHAAFLHQIVNYSTTDPQLSARGAEESRILVERVAALLPPATSSGAHEVARMLHQECTFRAMYGDHWLSREPEGFPEFVARLTRMAFARLHTVAPASG